MRPARPTGSACSRSWQLSRCCRASYVGSPMCGFGSMRSHPRSDGEHVARVRVGGQQHVAAGGGRQLPEQRDALPRQSGVQQTRSRRELRLELLSPPLAHGRQRSERVPGRRVDPQLMAAARRSPRPAPVPGDPPATSPAGSARAAAPLPRRTPRLACSRTAPRPAHARSPSASCSASWCGQATLSTRPAAAARSHTGATHAVCPPGWNGFSTVSDQASASRATVAGSVASQPVRPSRSAASTRLRGSADAESVIDVEHAGHRAHRPPPDASAGTEGQIAGMSILGRLGGRAVDAALGLPASAVAHTVERDVAVPMPDGVMLLGNLYRPAASRDRVAGGADPHPLRHGRGSAGSCSRAPLARRGFQVFLQATRGHVRVRRPVPAVHHRAGGRAGHRGAGCATSRGATGGSR